MKVGKTKIDIRAEGCTKCGTTASYHWGIFKKIDARIGQKNIEINIPICGDCLGIRDQEESKFD